MPTTRDITTGSVESWERGTGTPQIATGFGCGDTTRGYLQMWGMPHEIAEHAARSKNKTDMDKIPETNTPGT